MELTFIEKYFSDEILDGIGVSTSIVTICQSLAKRALAPSDLKVTKDPLHHKETDIYITKNGEKQCKL